ncbi:succinate dehydrogenase/fumarate reductase iron-sulfur subunit [Carboxydothermus hydrogenoformans]|uniref:Fumarate reductase iron-sulfur subunit n=1 Tax=Carboxydothermus hydrogenoformans (strain ATCC BAA-161 / DSM 6008 / Z-2901) TaxID=246194 RepID=Q3AFZ8_CARHZ|nr:succinate dehydrogenase/fumarate reductase iron-sulfur subunit [Carboxydothermus hydrogenoformans]ABB15027.1 fumarate reductase, iron-sulfur subunit [Carboxydothermus hydrogenoformans Z-2901]
MQKVTFKIRRFDGEKSWVQEYQFPYQPGKTILWALSYIKESIDPTLTFTASCRHAVCGACAVRVNGQAVLACETLLDKMLDRWETDTLLIEPLQNFKVIRDLVVDWETKVERLARVKPWLIPRDEFSKETGCRQTPEEFKKINKNSDCILCGCCASECNKLSNNDSDFLEPFIFSKAQKFIADSRDKDPLSRISTAINNGAWKCMHCQECVTKCPKGLSPADDISFIRQFAIANGIRNNPGTRHAKSFLDDIQKTGRLNEALMFIKTEGLLGSLGSIPVALRLVRKGKLRLKHVLAKPIKEIEQVRTIIKVITKDKK